MSNTRDRHLYVGSSESPALFGASPYMTEFELWLRKAGRLPEEDLSDDERIMAGTHLEPAIAAWAADKWSMKLRKVRRYQQHPTVKGMGCSVDFEARGTGDGLVPVEIKNVDWLVFKREWECEGQDIVDAPKHILLQVQHQLACTEAPYAWLIVNVGGNNLRRMKVEARPKIIAAIEQRVTAFWASVQEGFEPKPVFARDAATIMQITREVSSGKAIDLSDNNRFPALCAEYQDAAERKRVAEKETEATKAELLAIIGDAETATCRDLTVKAIAVRGTPDRIIQPDEVGRIIKGKSGHRRLSFKTETQQEKAA